MLKSSLGAATDCCFLIFIDGADEFEDFQHARGATIHANDLVDFLFDIQQPEHVKLCISSRPGLRINNVHPSFLEAKLAELNHDDIRRFVDEQMQAMTAITEPQDRNRLAEEVISRSDGIFLWAAFAITQMGNACRDGYGKDYSELKKRLEDMGEDLNDAISQMLRGIARSHRTEMAFYLQVLKSWKDCVMDSPFTLGLMVVSQYGREVHTRSQFLAACRRAQRDIQNFSQGIIEVEHLRFPQIKGQSALVRSHSNDSSESDLQQETLNFEPGAGAWVTVAHADHYLEITEFCEARVSLIHRSAYDYFFAPDHWNRDRAEQCRSLSQRNEDVDESNVPEKVLAGLRKLLWIKPWPMPAYGDQTWDLVSEFSMSSREVINYAVGNVHSLLTPNDLTRYMDDFFISMRLELLLRLIKAPVVWDHNHVPGDILSHQTYNSRLDSLDEEKLLIFESTGLREDLITMATFEAELLYACAARESLHDYIRNRLGVLNGRAIAPLVQAAFFARVVDHRFTVIPWWSDKGRTLVLDSVQRWAHSLNRNCWLLECFKSVWREITRLVSGHDNPRDDGLTRTRLDMFRFPRGGQLLFCQWTPLASGDTTDWREKIMIEALIVYSTYFARLPRKSKGPSIFGHLVRIMEPWDVWIRVHVAKRTGLFVRMSSLSTTAPKTCEQHPSDPRGARYRLTCVGKPAKLNESLELLFSVDIQPSMRIHGPETGGTTVGAGGVEARASGPSHRCCSPKPGARGRPERSYDRGYQGF
jgi:hypothetical protein